MAQKFKLDDLQDFVKIQFLDKNIIFDTVYFCCENSNWMFVQFFAAIEASEILLRLTRVVTHEFQFS